MIKNVIILGGTGQLGIHFQKFLKTNNVKNINLQLFSSDQYNALHIHDNQCLTSYIVANNISIIIDMTRNSLQSLMGMYFLLNKKELKNINYIFINSYNCLYNKTCYINNYDLEYINAKRNAKKYIRNTDIMLYIPTIIFNKNEITTTKNLYIQKYEIFNLYLLDIINNIKFYNIAYKNNIILPSYFNN